LWFKPRAKQKLWLLSMLFCIVFGVTDCQESLRRSFELGVQVGIYRHTRELLSWSKKRRRRIARDELIAHLCGKAVPTSRLRVSQSQKTPVKSTSTSALGRFASVDPVEPDLQLFHDALAVHGMLLAYFIITSPCMFVICRDVKLEFCHNWCSFWDIQIIIDVRCLTAMIAVRCTCDSCRPRIFIYLKTQIKTSKCGANKWSFILL